MSSRSTSPWLAVLFLLFIGGTKLPQLLTTEPTTIAAMATIAVLSAAIAAGTIWRRDRSYATIRRLLDDIRRATLEHLDDGNAFLALTDSSGHVSRLMLGHDNDDNIIVQVDPSTGAFRRYSITPTHQLRRTLIARDHDGRFTRTEQAWCHSPITRERLREILKALQEPTMHASHVY